MLIVISPAKTLDFESDPAVKSYSQAHMLRKSEVLIDILASKSPTDIEKLMGISPKLAELNVERYHNWSRPFRLTNAKQAVLAFKGDVYVGLQAEKFTPKQLNYAQDHLRILSGLYGLLKPLDLIQPYRLEMGIKLPTPETKNLYEYWSNSVTKYINKQIEVIDSKYLLNLASIEYFKVVNTNLIKAKIVSPVFKDWQNGQYKMISFFAKKARGSLSAWVLKNQVKSLAKLRNFNLDGYQYSAEDSSPLSPVFLRKQ